MNKLFYSFSDLGKSFNHVHNPYEPTDEENLGFPILLIYSWMDEICSTKDLMMAMAFSFDLVFEAFEI